MGKKTLLAFLFLVLFSISSFAQLPCPNGWVPFGNSKCQTLPPSSDYTYMTDPVSNSNRSVCGSDVNGTFRIPVLPSFEPTQISTKTFPNSSLQYTTTTPTLLTLPTSKADGTYLYDGFTRCVCMGAPAIAPTPAALPPANDPSTPWPGGNFQSGFNRIYPDTYDVISTQNQSGTVKYNMVAYTDDVTKDGRAGTNIATSMCGCPNINEQAVINGAVVSGVVGSHCEPLLNSDVAHPGRILTTYNLNSHGSTAPLLGVGQQVNNPAAEGQGGTDPTAQIVIPTNAGGSQLYDRKIWTCAPPYTPNFQAGFCDPPTVDWSKHACSNGGGVNELASPVSTTVSGGDARTKFDNTINKKLACCMNEYGGFGAFIKFDCVENQVAPGTTFDQLWNSSDSATDGGQPNAIILAGPLGKYLTGFYTLDGARCDQFSEFGGTTLQAMRLFKNAAGAWQNTPVGNSINIPNQMSQLVGGMATPRSLPTVNADRVRCPILVRAAMVATCPANPDLPVVQKTYEDKTVSPYVKHCSAAASIQVHVRIEQLFEIEGQPKMKTIDTVAEQRLASSISIDKIIANKNGNDCPGGATKQGDACVYQ